MIVLVVGEVDGAAGYLGAGGEHGFMHALAIKSLAAKCRDQGRMDIHDPAQKIIGDGQKLQKACHAHEIGIRLPAQIEDAAAELGRTSGLLAIDHSARNAGLPGTLQGEHTGVTGNNLYNLGGQPAITAAVEEILQRCAPAAHEDRQTDG